MPHEKYYLLIPQLFKQGWLYPGAILQMPSYSKLIMTVITQCK